MGVFFIRTPETLLHKPLTHSNQISHMACTQDKNCAQPVHVAEVALAAFVTIWGVVKTEHVHPVDATCIALQFASAGPAVAATLQSVPPPLLCSNAG